MWEKKNDPPSQCSQNTNIACRQDSDCPGSGKTCQNVGSSSSFDSQGVGNCLHCVNDRYLWTTAMSEWISAVNGRTSDPRSQTGFAGHTDWRLPTIVELQTIVDTNAAGCGQGPFLPCIDPIFGPTAPDYWSATSRANNPGYALNVSFFDGSVGIDVKASAGRVRAVRTGS